MFILVTLLSFFLGGLWFSPKLFGKIWCEGVNHQPNPNANKFALFLGVFGINLTLSLLKTLSAGFALKLSTNLTQYILLGGIFIFLIASVHVQNLYFAKRSPKAIAVEFGYQALDLVMIFSLLYFLA